MATLIFTILGYLLLYGVGFYYLETLVIQKISPKKFKEGTAKGLLAIGRKIHWRLWSSFGVVMLIALLFPSHEEVPVFETLFYWLIKTASVCLGFYLAPKVIKMIAQKWPSFLQYVENVDAGKVNPLDDLKDASKKGFEKVKDEINKQDNKHS